MRSPAERAQLLACAVAIGRLGEAGTPKRQRLVGAEHELTDITRLDRPRLLASKQQGGIRGTERPRPCFHRAFIEIRQDLLDRNTGSLEKGAPDLAARRQNQRVRREP